MFLRSAVEVRDVDTSLLRYFDNDATLIKPPGKPQDVGPADRGGPLADLTKGEKPSAQDRRAADPDGKFEWRGGVLRCPVRRHDFRLFEFRLKTK